ncbi:MAG: transcriptional repressor LexA [Syntrophomonadaceae bacterium]
MSDKNTLSPRENEILQFIKDKIRNYGYPPSIREIGKAVGLKSSSTVHSYIVQLEEKGFLRRDPTTPRALIPLEENDLRENPESIALPVVGHVAAGTPILAEQNIEDYLPVPAQFIGEGTHFILQVRGDSMVEAGILDGDFLIVRQQPQAANGEIAVVLVGEEEATVKRFYRREDHVELRPENSSMQPMKVRNAQVVGVVLGLFRTLQ